MTPSTRKLALVTGGSSGIGFELARQFLEHDFDVVIAADDAAGLEQARQALAFDAGRESAPDVRCVQADLSTSDGVRKLYDEVKGGGRPLDALAANAGVGLGHAFLDQQWEDVLGVINTNVTGTLNLLQLVGRDMRERGEGRILITSSVASLMPGSFQAAYNGSKAFLQSFSFALRNELKDTGVTVTALLPGPTDTAFFEEADMQDTAVGQSDKKDDPADVAKTGFNAMMKGEGDVVHGFKNKVQAAMAAVTPDSALAQAHRKMAEPGSGGD